MPLYVTASNSAQVAKACEQSPVVALMTNGARQEEIPADVRHASDRIVSGDDPWLRNSGVPPGCDAAISWMVGDRLLSGTSASLRAAALSCAPRVFWPVHLPCLPEIDLVGLQPRVCLKSQGSPLIDPAIRIAGNASPSPVAAGALEENREPWACLFRALLAEQKEPGAAIGALSKMWRDSSILSPVDGALVIRNLIVLEIKQNRLAQAEHLLNLAMDYYPRYAELPLLAAWICIVRDNLRRAGRYVQQALEGPDLSFVGGGGETSYRAFWLLGLAAELSGKQRVAVQCYQSGLSARPAFAPAVLGMLRQRLSWREAGNQAVWTLLSLVHREPQYVEPVFNFLLLHRQHQPARRLLQSAVIADDRRQELEAALDASERATAPKPRRRATVNRPGVMLIGSFWVNSSLGRINRELAAALARSNDFATAMEPHGFADVLGATLPHFEPISKGFKQRLERLDLTIRHHWPPDFAPAPSGKLVCIFPWEYGSMPRKWVEQIQQNATEIWAPSQFVGTVLVKSGVDPRRIQVIPNGINPEVFTPDGPSAKPEGCRGFVFLFVGGAIARKGADILWSAYARAFSSRDDVTLVIKDIGSATFYAGMSVLDSVRAAARQPSAPHFIALTEELDDSQLAALYRGCDAFVLPYRGEGFGMPLAEALACGKPVIATELGPAPEFCPPEASHFIPARVVEFENTQSPFGPATGPNTWFEPSVMELARIMRYAFEHREEGARQGLQAAPKIRAALSWNRVAALQLERVRQLTADFC